ncbi:hypothetical protein OBBRIDRAFT_786844 [Obba rivulosa]|uniref:Uncharacterized protein n=1 Tax=Obba rivulosa TaxID=1052685 RepID=A0A8E2AKA6_9APHY|nr:hypothetical protein OBBRIDRAFT_786844 [Obba rivulosa]
MKVQSSHHIQYLRHGTGSGTGKRSLDLEQLLNILHQFENTTAVKGKKRAASPGIDDQHLTKKARKGTRVDGRAIEDTAQTTVHPQSAPLTGVPRHVPVYQHILELTYTTSPDPETSSSNRYVDDEQSKAWRWPQQERELERWLESHKAAETTFELGELQLTASLYAASGTSALLAIPNVDPEFDPEAHDFRGTNMSDPLLACFWLSSSHPKRADVSARLQLIAGPQDAGPNTAVPLLPFRLRVLFNVSFVFPRIMEPVRPSKDYRDLAEIQRRVLLHIFPYGPPPDAFHGQVDIPLLYSVLGPAPLTNPPSLEEALQPDELMPTLLPFQRRSVGWMLAREGKTVDASGEVVTKSGPDASWSPLFWEAVRAGDGAEVWYVNRLRGEIAAEKPEEEDTRGGILAEEPGLGKTLECIALILMNPAIGRTPSNRRWDAEAKIHVTEVKTTLIVTPSSLASQWIDEFALHAPTLKVLLYEGWAKAPVPITEADKAKARAKRLRAKNKSKKRARKGKGRLADSDDEYESDSMQDDGRAGEEIADWCNFVSGYDVCITTFNTLQQDLNVARAPPTRPRRAVAEYSRTARPRSPLIMCEWYRVIMDEVQMVGGGKAEEMVSLIPRLSSFAVSGTPARAQVTDLIHVLKFLQVEPVLQPRIWHRLLKPGYVNEYASLFRRYAVRTMKAAVKDELTIPPQTRYLVPIELGRVERHVYDQNFENALLELGLDARGVAVREDWEPDTALLRAWLRKLRGICTHPQVGQLHDHAGLHKPGVLKTIGDVLEGMRDQNRRNLLEDWRNKVQAMTIVAQLQQHDESDPLRYRHALDTLLAAEKEASQLIAYVKAAMAEHAEKGKALKEEAAKHNNALEHGGESHVSQNGDTKGKGKDREEREDTPMSDLTDLDDEDLPKDPAGEEHAVKRRALQHRLRECRITLHKVLFLKGDVYHVLGESYAEDENAAYAAAEDLRRVLLKGTEEAAEHAMMQLSRNKALKSLKEADLYIKIPYCDKGGIRSSHLMEEANEMIDGLLNQQSALLWKWRETLKQLLTQPLTSSDENVDGQEYTRSLETQGEAEAYLQAYAALLADRREALTAERTLLAAHDVKEKKARRTKAAQRAEEAMLEEQHLLELETLEDEERQPEHQVLEKELAEERKALLEAFDPGRAIRSVMVDLNNIAARIIKEDDPEKIIAKDGSSRLRTLIAEQSKLMDRLQGDLSALRKAFNERILYFRQLQEISDTVAEAEWEGEVDVAVATARAEIAELDVKMNTGRARQRYMDHLTKAQEEGDVDEDDRCCILCRCEFTRGYITHCAHVFCETCMKEWLGQRAGKACPVCRVPIHPDQLQRFSIDQKQEQRAPPQLIKHRNELAPRSRRQIRYNVIEPAVFEDIQSMESLGSYGSKIQTLIRHLLYISMMDPGSKSIIFSAWADSLHIIEHALRRNGITCLRIDQNRGKQNAAKRFRTDPTISVLLLHGERENAGLNVTCAQRVFLVESVVNHAFEVQAIARIDRMGQQKPTEVYCYYAEDTVERNILDLAAKQGLSLYTKDNSAGTLTVSPLTSVNNDKKQVDSPAKKAQKGDFVSKTDDMLAIFFPHLFEDIEYLVPSEEENITARPEGSTGTNSVAGPSSLVS